MSRTTVSRTSVSRTGVALVAVLVCAGCTSAGRSGTARYSSPAPRATATADPRAADAALILTMYDGISRAFQRNPDAGVRALIAAQDPQDLADVSFARCVGAILPGATTLPRSKRVHFSPNIRTMAPDPGYTVTSARVSGVHPRGRIYQTAVTISDGGRPTVRERHQVVLDGKAYQFTSC